MHPWRKRLPRVFKIVRGQAELPQIINALGSPRSFASCLDCGKEQGNQHADDGDDNQQLD